MHIINILLTSFAQSARGTYQPLGLVSPAEAAQSVLPRPAGGLMFSPYWPHTLLIKSIYYYIYYIIM